MGGEGALDLVATCGLGLEGLLARELRELGMDRVRERRGAVSFRGSWPDCWRANYRLRTANRVLVELGAWGAPDDRRLADGAKLWLTQRRGARHGIEPRELLQPHLTFALHSTSSRSRIRDTRWASLRLKDGLVDAQRECFGKRSSISRDRPDLALRLRLDQDRASLLLDTSGESLDHRGYRLDHGKAPVRETLAAACVLASSWRGQGPIVDPMCGSGTLLIEAAWYALGWAPGRLRRKFGFEILPSFDRRRFRRLVEETGDRDPRELRLLGNDLESRELDAARKNLRRSGLERAAELRRGDARELRPPAGGPGLVVVNPPYGERVRGGAESERLLGRLLRQHFPGWKVVVLSGDRRRGRGLGLRPFRRLAVRNGPLEAEIQAFEIHDRKKDAPTPH